MYFYKLLVLEYINSVIFIGSTNNISMMKIRFFKIIMFAAMAAIVLFIHSPGLSAVELQEDVSVPAGGNKLVSGPVWDVPWEQDETFLKQK